MSPTEGRRKSNDEAHYVQDIVVDVLELVLLVESVVEVAEEVDVLVDLQPHHRITEEASCP